MANLTLPTIVRIPPPPGFRNNLEAMLSYVKTKKNFRSLSYNFLVAKLVVGICILDFKVSLYFP